MSYQVLARKWRPAKFEQMVGQSHVLHALTNALMQNRLHHAYLFSGTRGVGKTSLARLFAKGLNCEQGVTAEPCGQCDSCVEIAQGRFVDLIEVDAASRTKVDDTRELLDNIQYRPSRGRYKVYLIDEVHMLSRSSFNALLKTLEEPPEHVKFLLATTDPQRLPVTVLSRCLQFNLKSLTLDEISLQLSHILEQEKIPFDQGAVKLLAKSANGSMRDALSLTDQAIAFGAGQIQLAQVQTMLGTIDEHYVIVLLNALCGGDIGNLMQVVDEVLSFGAAPEEVLRSLLELLHQITLTQFAPAAAQLSNYAAQVAAFADQLTPEQVQLYYQLLLTGRKDLPHAPDPKSGLEMALLRAVAFVPETPVTKWHSEPQRQTQGAEGRLPAGKLTLPAMPAMPAKPEVHSQISASPLGAPINPSAANTTKAKASATTQLGSCERQAETKSASESQPLADSDPDVDCDDLSLLSEQALILSQANSQTQVVSQTVNETQAQSLTDEAAQTPELSQSARAYDYGALEHQQAPTDNGQDAQDYEAYLASQSDFQLAFSPESTDAEQVTQKAEEVDKPVTESVSDDLLDAVLAARDSLLSDLDAPASKESEAKKPESKVRAYVPPKRQSLQGAELNGDPHDEGHKTALQAADGNASPVATQASPAGESEQDDRPPWEAKAQAEEEPDSSLVEDSTAEIASMASDAAQQVSSAKPALDHSLPVSVTEMVSYDAANDADSVDEVSGDSTDLKWYRLMSALDIGGRVRQLAVNSVCQQFSDPLPLVLKPDQKHLEAPAAVAQLEEALSAALGETCRVTFSVGVVAGRETPLEIRKRFHRELLIQAEQELTSDENICWLTAQMNAQMVPDSLSFAPERLSQRGQKIELIDKSNFLELA